MALHVIAAMVSRKSRQTVRSGRLQAAPSARSRGDAVTPAVPEASVDLRGVDRWLESRTGLYLWHMKLYRRVSPGKYTAALQPLRVFRNDHACLGPAAMRKDTVTV